MNRATDGDVVAIELLPIEDEVEEEDAHMTEAEDEKDEKKVMLYSVYLVDFNRLFYKFYCWLLAHARGG